MNRLVLKAVARLTHVDIRDAVSIVRKNPILGDEIHIEEELINLEEAISTYHLAGSSLDAYPDMKQHLLREKRLVLKHCIGLIARMIQGKELPRAYTVVDVNNAVRRLVRLVVRDAERANIRIDDEVMRVMHPLLSFRQRFAYWDKPRLHLHMPAIGRFVPR